MRKLAYLLPAIPFIILVAIVSLVMEAWWLIWMVLLTIAMTFAFGALVVWLINVADKINKKAKNNV